MVRPQLDADGEARLLARFAAGDLGAARALTAALGPRILATATRMLGDRAEAEDVTQDAFLRLWQGAGEWEAGRARVSTWLTRVAMNLSIDRLRRRRGSPLDAIAEPADEAPSVAAEMQASARAEALRRALAELPDRQREAVVLRHIEGLSNPEIAEMLEIGVEAVESLTARAKRGLKALLADRKEELGLWDDN